MNWRRRTALACAAGTLITAGTVGLSVSEAQAIAPCGASSVATLIIRDVLWRNCLTVTVSKRGHLGPRDGRCLPVLGGATVVLLSDDPPNQPWSVTAC